jgi:serine/threonine-protein kinase
VIGLIGRGGMGEVYRADDLRLGQPVALKFLPDGLGRDPKRLAQFHNEVRTARQVSHPNVCRVHDIGEVGGHLYLSMEYVDGENLATSLRRIGRFPEDRALEIARQICAGVGAAHERGVLHRDLKPANIMLDATGRVRLMDFGLAAVGEVADIRTGTPAYMAPEQLQGREVTQKSDIFALGLVLFEIFTGRRVFQAQTIAELVTLHESGPATRPTEIVKGLDPAIERAIMRCLSRDPSKRPSSALAVAAALPGGDPLGAALAAGETPSPEVVAAAGGDTATIGPVAGVALVVVLFVGLLASAALASRFQLVAQVASPMHPRSLLDRARQLQQQFGPSGAPRDRAHGMFANVDIQSWLWSLPAADRQRALDAGWPSPILLWYRTSPRLLVPTDPDRLRATRGDPPLQVSDMSVVAVGMDGRLMEYLRAPRQIDAADGAGGGDIDWSPFFQAAGLDPAGFQPAEPTWTPPFFAETRRAWVERDPPASGGAPDARGTPLRIEASSHLGVPVSFQLVGPWARPVRQESAGVDRSRQIIGIAATVFVLPAVLTAGVLLARRNLRLGRGDRRGALVLAAAVFTIVLAIWVAGAHHFAALMEEQTRFGRALSGALFAAAVFALLYLACEPTVRRVWPQILITWSRLVGGRLRDPLVGRDLLVGAVAGMLQTFVTFAHHLLPGWIGGPAFRPAPVRLDALLDPGQLIASVLMPMREGLQNMVLGAVGLVLIRMLVRREWATFAVTTALFAPLAAQGQIETGWLTLDLLFGVVLAGLVLAVILRFGLVAGAVTFFVHLLTKDLPLTLDTSAFYFGTSVFVMAVVMAVAVLGFVWSRADQPWFGRLADD